MPRKRDKANATAPDKLPEWVDAIASTPYTDSLFYGMGLYIVVDNDTEKVTWFVPPRGSLVYENDIRPGTVVATKPDWEAGKDLMIVYKGEGPNVHDEESGTGSAKTRIFDVFATGERQAEVSNTLKNMAYSYYAKNMVGRVKDDYDKFKRQLTSNHKAVAVARCDLIQALKEAESLKSAEGRFRQVWSDGETSARKKFEDEYKKLIDNPKIQGIILDESILTVYTRTLYCTDSRTKVEYEIGAMKFEVELDAGTIHIFNMTRRVDGGMGSNQNAPHVDSQGDPCFGNIEGMIYELIGKHEVVMLIELLITFIESANVREDAGRTINEWPVSTRGRKDKAAAAPTMVKKDGEGNFKQRKLYQRRRGARKAKKVTIPTMAIEVEEGVVS